MRKKSFDHEAVQEIFMGLPQQIQQQQVEAALGSTGYTDIVALGDILYFMMDQDDFSFPFFGGFYVVVKKTKRTVSLIEISFKIFRKGERFKTYSLLPHYESKINNKGSQDGREEFSEIGDFGKPMRAWILDPSGVSEEGNDVGLMFKAGGNYGFKWDGRPVVFSLDIDQQDLSADNKN